MAEPTPNELRDRIELLEARFKSLLMAVCELQWKFDNRDAPITPPPPWRKSPSPPEPIDG